MLCSLSRSAEGLFVVLWIIVPVNGLAQLQGSGGLVQEQLIAVLLFMLLLKVL
jgi:hypothetical protein